MPRSDLPSSPDRRPGALAVLVALGAVAPALTLPGRARAQGTPAGARSAGAPRAGECFAFSFGAWTPPLDPVAAGHALPATPRDSSGAVRPVAPARGGAGAAVADSVEGGIALILFPEWWPAGVGVRLVRAAGALDTLRGTARAFVASGQLRVPTASVLALRVPCDRGAAPAPRPPAR